MKSIEKHHHDHEHHEGHQHEHHNTKWIIIAFFIGLGLYIVGYFVENIWAYRIIYLASLVLAGSHVIIEGIEDTISSSKKQRKFMPNIHLLMTVAAIGAIIIQEYREAALLILIFAGAHFLEDYAEGKSKKEITRLLNLNPTKARRLNVDETVELVDVSSLKIGDKLQVLNGDQIPTDGIILKGKATIDQSSITGESVPVDKSEGDFVFGSTQNGNQAFLMEVTKDTKDTVFSKIVELVSQTQTNVSKTAAFIKKIEPIYVNIVFILAPLFYLLGRYGFHWSVMDSFYRTMVFLIGASPCALAATDIPATLSAISNLAKRGVLFKGGSYLSNLADLKAVAFDKTGTLTEGKLAVTDVFFDQDKKDQMDYISILVSMEKQSNHPIAQAIVQYFPDAKPLDLEVENEVGVGITAHYQGTTYRVGKPSSFISVSDIIKSKAHQMQEEGKTVIYLGSASEVYGLIAIWDTPKPSSKEAIAYFKAHHIQTVMITGDSIQTAQAMGVLLGVDEIKGNVLPQDKAGIVESLKKTYGTTAMLGDGINDAPALVSADIGVAMGEGTDIAIDVADAVLMKNDLDKFVYTYQVSKKLRRVVWQNIIFSMIVVIFLLIMNVLGMMHMGVAVFIHEGSTLIVVISGLRLLIPIKKKNE